MSAKPAARRFSPDLWLRRTGGAAARHSRVAAALTVFDSLAAIGFAAGLAWAVTSLPRGVLAAAPGAGVAALAGVVRGALAIGAARAGADAASRAKASGRTRLVRAQLDLAPGERAPLGEMCALAVEAVEAMDGWFARFAPARAAASYAPVLIVLAMAIASPVSAGIAAATFVPFVAAMAVAGGAAANASRGQFEALSRLSGLFSDRIRALPVVLAFEAEAGQTAVIARASVSLARRMLAVLKIAFVSSAALDFFAALSIALVAVYCGFDLLRLLPFRAPEHLSLGRAVFVLALAPEAYAPLRRLAAAYHEREAARTAAERLDAASQRAHRQPVALAAAPALRFEQVSVRYPGQDRPALDGFDLSVEPGETIALIGPSGSGKSTVLNLLLGLTRPTTGAVFVGDAALDPDAPPAAAWASQAPVVIAASLADNIALARRDARATAILRAARLVGLAERAGDLDRWIDERGGGLSGGERRRLGLARAVLSDAPLLLLDEPTAGLDAVSEAAVVGAIREVARGRTTLIATHSRALADMADRIVRLAE